MTVSLIISTYNWPRALYLCLDSVMQQTVMPSEIIIADDGSGIATRYVVRDRKSTRLNSSHKHRSRMPSSA